MDVRVILFAAAPASTPRLGLPDCTALALAFFCFLPHFLTGSNPGLHAKDKMHLKKSWCIFLMYTITVSKQDNCLGAGGGAIG